MSEEYKTSNLVLATVLALDFPVDSVRLDEINRLKVVFGFTDSPELQRTVDEFRVGAVLVEPEKFHQKLRELRGEINEVKEKSY
jgi:hypothetical protein